MVRIAHTEEAIMTSDPKTESRNQGEGNREAAENFNRAENEFVRSTGGQQKIREGTHVPAEEEAELNKAEERAKERAKAQDSGRMS
jgi:membrane-bound lytic murein transglycosylase B